MNVSLTKTTLSAGLTERDKSFYKPLRFKISSRMASATSALLIRGSSRVPSGVMKVTTLVSTPKPAPATFRLLATTMSRFFRDSLAVEFSTISRVSMEKPQRNWWVFFGPMVPRMSAVRSTGMERRRPFS